MSRIHQEPFTRTSASRTYARAAIAGFTVPAVNFPRRTGIRTSAVAVRRSADDLSAGDPAPKIHRKGKRRGQSVPHGYESFSISDLVMHDARMCILRSTGSSGRAVALRLCKEPLTENIRGPSLNGGYRRSDAGRSHAMLNFMADLMGFLLASKKWGVTRHQASSTRVNEDPVDMFSYGAHRIPRQHPMAVRPFHPRRHACRGRRRGDTHRIDRLRRIFLRADEEGLRRLAEDPDADLSPDEIQRNMPVIGKR